MSSSETSRPGRLIALLALGLELCIAAICPAAGVPSSGLDLVVLVDQSGSMWGHPEYHPRPNDRYAHRVGATRAILERLAADVKGTSRVHRLSVVDFGDVVEVAWSNQVLRHDPKDPDALARRLEVEMPRRIIAREWINTNTPEALAVAISELQKMDATEPLPNRRRIVLLVTDGRPQLPPAGLDLMKERSRSRARDLFAARAELWVVALNDASNYWLEGDGAFWQDLVGDPSRTHLAERAVPDLPNGIDRMVGEWLAILPTKPDGPSGYTAPPYLGHLAFRVSFEKPRDPRSVQIAAPDGRTLPRVSASGGAPSTYARFALDDPPPGLYALRSTEGAVHLMPEPHPPTIHRLAPAEGADLEVETRVVHRVELGSGKPLEPLADWPLTAVVEVEAPGSGRVELAAAYEGEGKFVSRWRPTVAGVHHLRLRGRTRVKGKTVDVFAGARGTETAVDVSKARPLWLRLEYPAPESGLFTQPWATSARVRLALVDGNGKRVDPQGLVSDLAGWLRLEKLDASGVTLGDPLPLTVDDRGHFEATVPIEPDWRGSRGLFSLGELYLRVRSEPRRLPKDRVLRAIVLPEILEDQRVGGDPLSVGPIPIKVSRWLGFAALAGVLGLVLGILALAAARLVPAWRIQRRGGRPIALRVYDIVNDPSGAAAQTFPVTGGMSFKLDGRVRLSVGGETKIADRFRLTRLDSPGRARARLAYRWLGEKKTQETHLTAGGGPKTLKVEAAIAGRPVAEMVEV